MRLNGHYLDGKTSQRHPVEVMPTVAALHIYAADGALVGKWSYQGLKLVDEGLKGQVVRFQYDIHKLIGLYMDGKMKIDELIGQELTLEQVNKGFDDMRAGNKVARSVIRFD